VGTEERAEERNTEKMSDAAFRVMAFAMKIDDFLLPFRIRKRVKKFGIESGMTVVDYGCGPGRYTIKFAELVGKDGKVYAVDIHELAIEAVRKIIAKHNIDNIEPVLIEGYNSTLPDNVADVVCAIDMFIMIKEPTEFLAELKRITKNDGTLVIDDSHKSRFEKQKDKRQRTKDKINASGFWSIVEETKDHLKCKPK
jgi:ubiquinone/menaquinone biosynthesis C-methylase UbiE